MKAEDIAKKAAELVSGDREKQHGDKLLDFTAIADLWNGFFRLRKSVGGKETLDAHDVGNMMELLKIARRYTGDFNVDDYVDGAGYSACAGEVKARLHHKDSIWVRFLSILKETK